MLSRPASISVLRRVGRRLLAYCALSAALAAAFSLPSYAAGRAKHTGHQLTANAEAVAAAGFDRGMLAGSSARSMDLARFDKGATVMPGTYNVDVYLNKQWVGRMNVRFQSPAPDADALPCITRHIISRMQIKVGPIESQKKLSQPGACVQLSDLIPAASEHFDMSNLELHYTVPQTALNEEPRGYVSPASWDTGVSAFLLNYQFNAFRNHSQGSDQTSAFLGLDSGLNIGAWRIRQRGTLNWATGYGDAPSQHQWHSVDLYARRALPGLKSELTFGDTYTDGSVFDSYSLVGLQLATDDRMVAPSRRGYAPVVRGVAQTNAKVTIRQNGVEIYQTVVPPGPFAINDLYPTGTGGALQVTVTEADGRQRTYEVPYASTSQLQRPGMTRYSVDAGQLRDLGVGSPPDVLQAAVQHGFTNLFTGYAGIQGSNGYVNGLIGGAFNTRAGAFAVDLSVARTKIPGYGTYSGRSLGLTWSKMIAATRTQFSVAAYRYSTSGYFTLTEAAIARGYASQGENPFQIGGPATAPVPAAVSDRGLRRRNRFTLSLSQPLGPTAGSFYGDVAYSDYWGNQGSSSTFQLGYRNQIGSLSFGLSVARTRTPTGAYDNTASLSLSVPLGGPGNGPTLSANLNRQSQGSDQEQATVSQSLGKYNQYTWSASMAHDGGGTSASVGGGYSGSYGIYSASYDAGAGYSQLSVGTSGSLVAHQGGVTFGQPLGDTIALVHAPGAAGAHLLNGSNVTVDNDGYAIVPNLTPFRRDTIGLNPDGAGLGVQLDASSTSVAPYAGAVVMVNFKTHYGRALVVHLHRADGIAVPFGADVVDSQGRSVGTVGQAGRALLTVHRPSGELTVHWQSQAVDPVCRFHYALPKKVSGANGHSYPEVDEICKMSSGQ